jgi:ABC-type multidrug transport system ATPase subunit
LAVPVIDFSGTVKVFGEKKIGPVSFSVGKGEIFGFLGPNGSGKTTCIRMLLGLVRPSAGTVQLNGKDPLLHHIEALDGVGYSPELPNIQAFLTPREVLRLAAAETGLKQAVIAEVDRVLEEVGIINYKDVKVGKLSKGMVQRLSVALAMLGSPRTMILDEPMIGLDPAGTAHLREVFRAHAHVGGTILMSSHMMSEVEDLCTSVGMIHNGRLVFNGALKDMVSHLLAADEVRVEAKDLTEAIVESISHIEGVLSIEKIEGGFEAKVKTGVEVRPAIARTITESGAQLLTIGGGSRMLEKAYIEALKSGRDKAQ